MLMKVVFFGGGVDFVNFDCMACICFHCSQHICNMFFILYCHYKNIGYIWRGITTITRPLKLYTPGPQPRIWHYWNRRCELLINHWRENVIICMYDIDNNHKKFRHAKKKKKEKKTKKEKENSFFLIMF